MIEVDYSRDELLTNFGLQTLNDRYLLKSESSPQEAFARAAEAYSDDDEMAQRIYDYASNLWFMFSTPILTNGGAGRGLPISCNLNYVPDSREGLTEHYKENAYLSSVGAGIGGYWGAVRPDSSAISNGGKSTGSIPFLKVVDSEMLAFQQGKVRRGSYAAYQDIWHPEIVEFLNIRKPTGGDANRKCLNLHHGVNIPDSFMRIIEECQNNPNADPSWPLIDPSTGETVEVVDARELWQSLLEIRMETGEPYLAFIDTINRNMNPFQKSNGLRILQSNLCVAPETPVLTKRGYQPISSLRDKNVDVWNGKEWSSVIVQRTGHSKLVRVHFSDGSSLDCTPYHKFYVQEKYGAKPVEKRAHELSTDDKLEKFELPLDCKVGRDSRSNEYAYSRGFYAGDGNEGYNSSKIYPPKHVVAPKLIGGVSDKEDSYGRLQWYHGYIEDKFYVPFEFDLVSRLQWLAGLIDADGCVLNGRHCNSIQISSVKPSFVKDLKLFLQEIGVPCKISLRREEGQYELPKNNGTDELAYYDCDAVWLVGINGVGVKRLVSLGIATMVQRVELSEDQRPNRQALEFVRVSSVENIGRVEDTYCFNESKRHRGVFNGVLTGQCSETLLPTGPDQFGNDRTAVCCLSSINLEKTNEWWDHPSFVEDLIRFLDNVTEYYIHNAPSSLSKAAYSARMERALGLGTMGLHSYFQRMNVPFDSALAYSLNRKIYSTIWERANQESERLAEERGVPEDLKGSNKRNAYLIAIAPNASSSIICGETSPSIEPIRANAYTHKTQSGTFFIKNRYLDQILRERMDELDETEDWLDRQWKNILLNKGSVADLDCLTEWEKDVFKTASEIDQQWVIELASARQPYIDQGQSTNLFFVPDTHKKDFHTIHFQAWKKGLKTLYYCRAEAIKRGDVAQKQERQEIPETEECVACEG